MFKDGAKLNLWEIKAKLRKTQKNFPVQSFSTYNWIEPKALNSSLHAMLILTKCNVYPGFIFTDIIEKIIVQVLQE